MNPTAPIEYTVEDGLAHVERHREEIMANYHASPDIPQWMRSPRLETMWQAGCWLNSTLCENGASEAEVHDIGFAHGQRCVFGDPWKWAVIYANEYRAINCVRDQPGKALADAINREHIGTP